MLSGVATSCGVGCRLGSDPVLLWLWRRPVAAAPTGPLAWEPPHAPGAALEKATKKKKEFLSSKGSIQRFSAASLLTDVQLLHSCARMNTALEAAVLPISGGCQWF